MAKRKENLRDKVFRDWAGSVKEKYALHGSVDE
jgi:hypothetical protein